MRIRLSNRGVVALSLIFYFCMPAKADGPPFYRLVSTDQEAGTAIVRSYVRTASGNLGDGFKSPVDDFSVKIADISPEAMLELKAGQGSLPLSKLTRIGPAMGISPDCREVPISWENLQNLAKNKNITDTVSLNHALPPGSMQTFTMIYDTGSVQTGTVDGKTTVSRKSPRALRATNDGKLFMTWTCDPKGDSYNTIEVIHWNDQESKWDFSEINLRNKGAPVESRIKNNLKNCASCHDSTGSNSHDFMKPIWGMYPSWHGVYGGYDDYYGLQSSGDEGADLLDFKSKVISGKDEDPCYSALPWPKGTVDDDYKYYPYSTVDRTSDYGVRRNLKLTETMSRMTARQIASRLEKDPRFWRIKYLLAMEAAGGCGFNLDDEFSNAIPGYRSLPTRSTYEAPSSVGYFAASDPLNPESSATRLYSVSQMFGLNPGDWSLQKRSTDPYFESAIPIKNGSGITDGSIVKTVQAEIVQDIAKEVPELGSQVQKNRGVEGFFGKNFSCLDDLPGQIDIPSTKDYCKILEKKYKQAKKEAKTCPIEKVMPGAPIQADELNQILSKIPDDSPKVAPAPSSPEHGKQIVSATCKRCHSQEGGMPERMQFFESEEKTESRLTDPAFADLVANHLHAQNGATQMPPTGPLNAFDQDSVLKYIRGLPPAIANPAPAENVKIPAPPVAQVKTPIEANSPPAAKSKTDVRSKPKTSPIVSIPHPAKPSAQQIARGKGLVEVTCAMCHVSQSPMHLPKPMQFFEDDGTLKKALADPAFRKELDHRLRMGSGVGKMPPGRDFTTEEQDAIEAFLGSLIGTWQK